MSGCRFITPKIGENKDKKTQSVLYANILDTVKDPKTALNIYQAAYSRKFIDQFGDWINKPESVMSKLDNNGEPKFKEVLKFLSESTFSLSKNRNLEYFKKQYNIDKVFTLGQAQELSEKINKLYPGVEASWDARADNKGVVNIEFNTHDNIGDRIETGSLSKELISKLLDKFPKANVQYITEGEIKSILGQEFNLISADVNAFNHNGTVYLIEGRTNNEMAIEEFLHPFIANILKDNPKAAQILFEDAKKNFPQLWTSIQKIYSGKRFSNSDRVNELISQAIAKVANKEFEENGLDEVSKESWLKKVENLWSKLRELISSLISNSDNRIHSEDIAPGTTIRDIASLLGIKDVTFNTYNMNNDPSHAVALDTYFHLSDEEKKGEDPVTDTDTPDDVIAKMLRGLTNYENVLISRKNFFKEFNQNKKSKFQFQNSTINGIEALIAELGTDMENLKANYSKGELIRIYSKMLDSVQTDASKISSYINNKANIGTDAYISVVIEGKRMIDSYQNLRVGVDMGMTNVNVEAKMNKTIDQLNTLKDDMQDAFFLNAFHIIKNNTSEKLTDDEIWKLLKEAYDINQADYHLGDITTSPDKLLAIVGKLHADAVNEVRENTEKLIETINEDANNLLKANGVKLPSNNEQYRQLFNFMIAYDKNGNFTGKLVQKVGAKYDEARTKSMEGLYDEKGNPLEYYEISDISKATPEQLEHNKKLQSAKKIAREFNQSEYSEDGVLFDGNYHEYDSNFKKEREKFEFFTGNSWSVRPEVEGSKEYTAYKNKYYSEPITTLVAIADYNKATGSYEHKGRTEWRNLSFVRREYVNVKEKTNSGVDLRDPKWVKLNNPTTALENAQLKYYNTYINTYNSLLDKLPERYKKEMEGKLVKIKMGMFNNMMDNKSSFINIATRSFRNWFKAPEYSAQRVTDENGLVSDEIPLFYHGDFQSEKRVKAIEADIAALKNDLTNKKISQESYTTKRKELTQQLNFEQGKVRADEASLDLVEGLTKFAYMAENYHIMSNLEDTIKSIGEVIKDRKVKQTDFKGKDLYTVNEKNQKVPVYKNGIDSLTYKRFSQFMHMVMYNNSEIDNSTIALVANKVQTVTSLSKIGLNIFSGINNYVMGRINNAVEAAGGRYYDLKTLTRAGKEFNTRFMPNTFKKLGENFSKNQFGKTKVSTKYEAFVEEYDIVRELESSQGNPHNSLTNWLYWMQKGGEYAIQSKSGIATLMKQMLTNIVTGEKVSIYDAHDFDSKTGKLTLKEGFEYSKQDKNRMTNMIHEINKLVHGNYADNDRAVIQQHWYGQLGMQFHKWLYPAFKARFKKRYYDENLGTMEGRYLTLGSFLSHGMRMITDYKNISASWNEAQKANMRKNLCEFGFIMASVATYAIFSALASGVPPDDKNLKRFVDFLQYQQSKQLTELITLVPVAGVMEQYQLVSNPMPAVNSIHDFAQAMYQTMMLPYNYMTDSMYYTKGTYEGDLKVAKEWRDVIPGLYSLNRWDSFDTVKSYYIK